MARVLADFIFNPAVTPSKEKLSGKPSADNGTRTNTSGCSKEKSKPGLSMKSGKFGQVTGNLGEAPLSNIFNF